MDKKTRKILTIYKCIHPRDDFDRLYWKRVEGGRGLKSVEDVVEIEKCSLGYYLTKTDEEFLQEVKIENIFKEVEDPKNRKKTIINRRKESFLEKKIHPVFWKGKKEIRDRAATGQCLKKGTLNDETEGMILPAQNQALRTKWMRHHIDKDFEISPTCRICGLANETISHIVSESHLLAQKDYKNVRHDKIATAIHRDLCKKYVFEYAEKCCNHHIDKESRVLENDEVNILWDFTIQTEKKLDYNKSDLVILT
ncbi:Hypothetical predicted protein [Paramuricea clavata]|uniref:Uncharacterized protein n=1 Tax=Paramuricea clavata TaxID=317549 RepID=A0A6S7J168_PARCT|nr:Hypothetical predicted protein [Paramuricea clavata]